MEENEKTTFSFPLNTPLETVKIIDPNTKQEKYMWLQLKKYFTTTTALDIEDCYEFIEPGQYICQRCGAIITSNPGPPSYCTECERNSIFQEYVPSAITGLWEDITFEKIQPIELNLVNDIIKFAKKAIVLREDEYLPFALAIIGTWKIECFPTYPYLLFMGAIESGKTRALDIIRLLAYHGMSAGAVSLAALPRLTEKYKVSLTEDEAQIAFDIRSAEGRERLKIYKVGYRRGQKYIIADKEHPDKIIAKDVYGFKAIASEKTVDNAIQSRSIIFLMEEGIPEIRDLRIIEKEAEKLRSHLLIYRYFFPDPLELFFDTGLRGRQEELFTPLIRVAIQLNVDVKPLIEFAKKQKILKLKEMGGTIETTILFYLYDQMNNEQYENTRVYIKDIASFCDADSRTIGRRLKDLHIHTNHSKQGNFVALDDTETRERLDYLFKKYDVTEEKIMEYKEVAGKLDDDKISRLDKWEKQ